MDPIDRATLYPRTPAPIQDRLYKGEAQHKTPVGVKTTVFIHNLHWTEFFFFTSAMKTVVQMEEMSKLGRFLIFPVCCVGFNLKELLWSVIYMEHFGEINWTQQTTNPLNVSDTATALSWFGHMDQRS